MLLRSLSKIIILVYIILPAVVSSQTVPNRFDIVIDEIMADPSPSISLPESEWVELRNNSGNWINLQGCRLAKANSLSGPIPDLVLPPDSMLIVCGTSALAALSTFGRAIAVTSFPSLANTGDLIYLRSAEGLVIHSVNYSDSWYQNTLKQQGGWSLEMRDCNNPCSGASNWIASIDASGGTPGKINSVSGYFPDLIAPKPYSAFATDSITIEIRFDEPLDSISAILTAHYFITDGIGVPSIALVPGPIFNKVILTLSHPLLSARIYSISVTDIMDCAGNISTLSSLKLGLCEDAESNDVIINEILFNPPVGGSDYVEIYNRSDRIINLKEILTANRNTVDSPINFSTIIDFDHAFFPKEFIVLCSNSFSVMRDHYVMDPSVLLEISSMPSFSDDEGNVILMNKSGHIIDEVSYQDDWHFKLITNTENVALERIYYDGPSNESSNWHSAASDAGFGTPTYKNSQMKTETHTSATLVIDPPIFSPDNDGYNDVASLRYKFNEPGNVVNITIFDASGRPVRYLKHNALAGISGNYKWDGLDEKGKELPSGLYIFFTDVFDLMGRRSRFRSTVVLGRRR